MAMNLIDLNPQHPKSREMRELWVTFMAMLMHKQGLSQVEFTIADVHSFAEKYQAHGGPCLVTRRNGDNEVIELITMEQGRALVKSEASKN